MTVKSIGAYEFPSRSRQELYGDDQLVHVWFTDTLWFAAAACFRRLLFSRTASMAATGPADSPTGRAAQRSTSSL